SFFFSSRRRHTRFSRDWSSDVCSSDLALQAQQREKGDIPTGHALHDERGVTTVKLFLDKIQGNTSHDGLRTFLLIDVRTRARLKIGRASCRERVKVQVDGGTV